jgi:hypothetical protein
MWQISKLTRHFDRVRLEIPTCEWLLNHDLGGVFSTPNLQD